MKTTATILVILLLAPATFANDDWEDRLRAEMDKVEEAAAKLDGGKAVRNTPLEERIAALHARLIAMEKSRGMTSPQAALKSDDASSRLQTLSAAVIGLSARLRKVKQKDSPPAVTPSKPAPTPQVPREAEPEDAPVEWPETLQVKATASVDYWSVGDWEYRVLYPTRWDQRVYRLHGYEGKLHFSVRLVGLMEQVRDVDLVLFVTGGTGPFRFKERPRYEVRWRARHRHMWNSALKQLVNYDTWSQNVRPRWGGRHRKAALRPSVVAYISRLTTKEGKVVTFTVPK